MPDSAPSPLPSVPFMRFDEDGRPYLAGVRCGGCGAVAPGTRMACNACGAREGLETLRLAEQGKLYSYTIVHRSFPGVKTPFISAIVDLADGGALRGTLIDVPADPDAIAFDMPVRVVFEDSGQTSPDGSPFLSYYFAPAGAARL